MRELTNDEAHRDRSGHAEVVLGAEPGGGGPMIDRMSTVAETAAACGRHPNWVRRKLYSGQVPGYRCSANMVRIPESSVVGLGRGVCAIAGEPAFNRS